MLQLFSKHKSSEREMEMETGGAEAVIRYLDYRSQAQQRRKELDSLREKCIANSRNAPIEAHSFLEEQRSMLQEQRKRRQEAKALLNRVFTESSFAPVPVFSKDHGVKEEPDREDTLCFVDQYRSAKESILRRTEDLWKDSHVRILEHNPMPLCDAVEACAKRWVTEAGKNEPLMSEAELLLTSSDDSDEAERPSFDKADKSKWTLFWLSFMTMSSSNVFGLMLSLTLLYYNLNQESTKRTTMLHRLDEDTMISMYHDDFRSAHKTSLPEKSVSMEYTGVNAMEERNLSNPEFRLIVASAPTYKGLRETFYQVLNENLCQKWVDSSKFLQDCLHSVPTNTRQVADPRIFVPSSLLRLLESQNCFPLLLTGDSPVTVAKSAITDLCNPVTDLGSDCIKCNLDDKKENSEITIHEIEKPATVFSLACSDGYSSQFPSKLPGAAGKNAESPTLAPETSTSSRYASQLSICSSPPHAPDMSLTTTKSTSSTSNSDVHDNGMSMAIYLDEGSREFLQLPSFNSVSTTGFEKELRIFNRKWDPVVENILQVINDLIDENRPVPQLPNIKTDAMMSDVQISMFEHDNDFVARSVLVATSDDDTESPDESSTVPEPAHGLVSSGNNPDQQIDLSSSADGHCSIYDPAVDSYQWPSDVLDIGAGPQQSARASTEDCNEEENATESDTTVQEEEDVSGKKRLEGSTETIEVPVVENGGWDRTFLAMGVVVALGLSATAVLGPKCRR